MKKIQKPKYEMLLRVRDFGNTYGELFSGHPVARQAFDAVNAAVDGLTTTDVLKQSASMAKRADRKAAARTALITVLTRVGQLARILRAQGRTIQAFPFPEPRTDQGMLTAARQFARDLAPFDAEFTGHRIGPVTIMEIAAAFEAVVRDCERKRAEFLAARTRIHDLLTSALLDVTRLDLIVDHVVGSNNPIQAIWKQARRVEKTRGRANLPAPGHSAPAPTSVWTDGERRLGPTARGSLDRRREAA